MRITIEPETDKEKETIREPVVYTEVARFGLTGRKVDNADFGHLHGEWINVKADLARMEIECDTIVGQNKIVQAVLQARQVVAHQAAVDAATADVLKRRNGFPRIQTP